MKEREGFPLVRRTYDPLFGAAPVHFVHFVTELSYYYYATKLILRLSKSLSTTLADLPGSTSEVYACMSRCYSMPHESFFESSGCILKV